MSSIIEIEAAIQNLPGAQVDQLARWLDEFRRTRGAPLLVESWLQRAHPGIKTKDVMTLARGEE